MMLSPSRILTVNSARTALVRLLQGARTASTRNIEEIAPKPSLHHEVKKIVESWVRNLNENPPTEAQNEELKRSIFDLDKRVENEKITQGGTTSTLEHSTKTIDDLPDDITPDTSKPSTLKELAQYILESFADEKLKELEFAVFLSKSPNLFFESRVEFEEALKHVENDQILMVRFGDCCASKKFIQDAYNHVHTLLCTTKDLIKMINSRNATPWLTDENVVQWDEDLVKPIDERDLSRIIFCPDYSKASGLIVSGESGSGKTWFSTRYIPTTLGEHDLALIYYSLDSNDGHEMIKSNESLENHKMACDQGMMYLRGQKLAEEQETDFNQAELGDACEANQLHGRGHDDSDLALGDVYQCLRDLSREYHTTRDTMVYNWLETTIGNQYSDDPVISEWWKPSPRLMSHPYSYHTIKKLVLVVDEVGKNPELADGLVSIVRELYCRIIGSRRAKQVLLVLVGSGLDRHFRNDRLAGIASFGTDPMKSQVILLGGPVMTTRNTDYK